MTTPDGLTAEEREVLSSLGGASLFEYDAARYHDEQVRDSMGDVAYYDRRILLVTVDRAVRTLARHVRETGDALERTLASARFVATYWRDAWMEQLDKGERYAPLVTHPLAMVLGALDGETDPVHLGISHDRHADYRAALAPTVAASEAERPLTPGEIRAANDIMRALGAPIPPEAPSPATEAERRGGEG